MKGLARTWNFGDYKFYTKRGNRLDILCEELKSEFPNLKMGHKRDIWWHWVIHFFVCLFTFFINRKYISGYTTTTKNRIDLGDSVNKNLLAGFKRTTYEEYVVWCALVHERVHLRQFRDKGTPVMVFLYLFPPVFICYGRAVIIEKPAYLATLRAAYVYDPINVCSQFYRNWWVSQFVSAAYGWAWIFKGQVESWFDTELLKLKVSNPPIQLK